MWPILKSGDGLSLYIYKNKSEMRRGDIIVYKSPEKKIEVVHRIIKIYSDGVLTRGDNNNKIDPHRVKFAQIEGKVISARRRTRELFLTNGFWGLCIHRILIFRVFVRLFLIRYLKTASDIIFESKIFNFFSPLFKTKVLCVNRDGKKEYLLVHKNTVIGKRFEGHKSWKIRAPYKYFIKG